MTKLTRNLIFKKIVPIVSSKLINDEIILVTLHSNLLFVLKLLQNHVNYKYKVLSCISGVDLLDKKYRFCIAYDLLSIVFNTRIRVKTFVDESNLVPSAISIYVNANWWEREIWDLYGVYFNKHTDLRRILTDYGFQGHPMRKDFPLYGYTEVCYNEKKKRITSEVIQLTQEFRNFSFEISV